MAGWLVHTRRRLCDARGAAVAPARWRPAFVACVVACGAAPAACLACSACCVGPAQSHLPLLLSCPRWSKPCRVAFSARLWGAPGAHHKPPPGRPSPQNITHHTHSHNVNCMACSGCCAAAGGGGGARLPQTGRGRGTCAWHLAPPLLVSMAWRACTSSVYWGAAALHSLCTVCVRAACCTFVGAWARAGPAPCNRSAAAGAPCGRPCSIAQACALRARALGALAAPCCAPCGVGALSIKKLGTPDAGAVLFVLTTCAMRALRVCTSCSSSSMHCFETRCLSVSA